MLSNIHLCDECLRPINGAAVCVAESSRGVTVVVDPSQRAGDESEYCGMSCAMKAVSRKVGDRMREAVGV